MTPTQWSQFVRIMDKRLTGVMESRKMYNEPRSMISKLYDVKKSDSAWEEYFSTGALGDLVEFTNGVEYDGIYPGFHCKVEPKEFILGTQIQRKFLDDKRWPVFDDAAAELQNSADRTREKWAVRLFNNATSVAYDFQTNEEGVSLASSSHTTKSGASTTKGFNNSGTSALSKTSVGATRIKMMQYRNDRADLIEPDTSWAIIHPLNLSDTFYEINRTQYGLDTAEGNKNPQYQRYEGIEYQRLDDNSSTSWGMVNKTLMKKSIKWINRIVDDVATNVDFQTKLTQTSLYARFGYAFLDWRWIHWHTV